MIVFFVFLKLAIVFCNYWVIVGDEMKGWRFLKMKMFGFWCIIYLIVVLGEMVLWWVFCWVMLYFWKLWVIV